MTVKVFGAEQKAVHQLHVAVKHIAGAVGRRIIISLEKLVLTTAQLFNRIKGRARGQGVRGPLFKQGDILLKGGFVGRVIKFPNLCTQFRKMVLSFGTGANFDEGMEETQDRSNVREEFEPGIFSGCPTININRLRRVRGVEVVSLSFERVVCLGQSISIGSQRGLCPQDTPIGDGGSNKGFLTIEMGMFFISQDSRG